MFSERRVCDLHVTFELIGEFGGDCSRGIIVHSYVFLPFGNSGGIIPVPIDIHVCG